jgi:hypothetical protein
MQEVVAQAIRSRRWLRDPNLWDELAARLNGDRGPIATMVEGSDDEDLLRVLLELKPSERSESDDPPWTVRAPVILGEIGIVQPGLSRAEFVNASSQREQRTRDGLVSADRLF